MNIRERILSEGDFHCPHCRELVKDAEEAIAVSMYMHKKCEDESTDVLKMKRIRKKHYGVEEQIETPKLDVSSIDKKVLDKIFEEFLSQNK